jgi:hypothetical protein
MVMPLLLVEATRRVPRTQNMTVIPVCDKERRKNVSQLSGVGQEENVRIIAAE